jgi:hypothetical protein
MNKRIVTVAALVLAAGIGGYVVFHATRPMVEESLGVLSSDRPVWNVAAWPFPIDQWGQGWAYQCKAADCGVAVTLYIRPKIGFCNCQTGVADDEELDRVGDVDLVGSESSAIGPGRPIVVHWMKGRSRSYAVAVPAAKSVLSVAFNNRCDVIVATIVADGKSVAHEQAVLEFLNGDVMRRWAEAVLGV